MKLCPNDIFEGKLKTSFEYRYSKFQQNFTVARMHSVQGAA